MIQWCKGEGFFWFRIGGRGWVITDRSIHPALFSERTGLVQVFRFGKWAVRRIK